MNELAWKLDEVIGSLKLLVEIFEKRNELTERQIQLISESNKRAREYYMLYKSVVEESRKPKTIGVVVNQSAVGKWFYGDKKGDKKNV